MVKLFNGQAFKPENPLNEAYPAEPADDFKLLVRSNDADQIHLQPDTCVFDGTVRPMEARCSATWIRQVIEAIRLGLFWRLKYYLQP